MTLLSSQQTAQTSPSSAPTLDLRIHLNLLYGTRRGYAELSYVDGDPRPNMGGKYVKAGYYAMPSQRPALERDIAFYSSLYGNVYVSSTLYGDKSRKRPLPTPILFLDDAPEAPALPYSFSVQTSATSRHGYYLLDQALSNDERRNMQRSTATALNSDKSGADLQQIVRVPGSYNTKGHGHFAVSLATSSGQHYSIEQLQAVFPSAPAVAADKRDSAFDWKSADLWLGNMGALLGNDGMPRRMTNAKGQARRLLAAGPLDDTSATRYIIARGLALHGYQTPVIAALLLHFCDYDASSAKGSAWLEQDIERVIGKVIADLGATYRPSAERGQPSGPPAQRAQIERKRKGRPKAQGFDAGKLLRWLLDNQTGDGKLLGTRKENAAQLGISLPTLDRLERTLRDAQVIERHTNKSRRDSWVAIDQANAHAFLSAIKNGLPHPDQVRIEVLSAAPINPAGMPDPSNDAVWRNTPPPLASPATSIEPAMASTAHAALVEQPPAQTPKCPPAQAKQGAQAGACVPSKASPVHKPNTSARLSDLVSEAFDRIPKQNETLDRSTGEIIAGDVVRVTCKRVRSFVQTVAGQRWSDATIDRAYEAERKRRTRQSWNDAQNPIAQAYRELATASGEIIRERARSTAAGYAKAAMSLAAFDKRLEKLNEQESKALAPKRAQLARSVACKRTLASIWAQEEKRRSDLVEQEEAALFALADAALDELRTAQPVEARPEALALRIGRSVLPTLEPCQLTIDQAAPASTGAEVRQGLYARLKALRTEVQHAA